jgi:predicted HAD superfamily Cof-like phosphohydrolase
MMKIKVNHDWVKDIGEMHDKYGVHSWVGQKLAEEDFDSLKEFLKFRISFLEEELAETKKAVEEKDAEEVVDGLVDLCVVAIGTLDAFRVNSYNAWGQVKHANMTKEVGVKESRPNPLGLPDLIKPKGWQAPSHENNHGIMKRMWNVRSDDV